MDISVVLIAIIVVVVLVLLFVLRLYNRLVAMRNKVRNQSSGDAEAQAWGAHDVGYDAGLAGRPRAKPAKSSGSLPRKASDTSSCAPITRCASST